MEVEEQKVVHTTDVTKEEAFKMFEDWKAKEHPNCKKYLSIGEHYFCTNLKPLPENPTDDEIASEICFEWLSIFSYARFKDTPDLSNLFGDTDEIRDGGGDSKLGKV